VNYTLSFTSHALFRMAQRNLSLADVMFVVTNGTRYWRAGALHLVLLFKDIPKHEQRQFARLEGTVVLLDREGEEVRTVYRGNARQISKRIRCKTKLDLKKGRAYAPQEMMAEY